MKHTTEELLLATAVLKLAAEMRASSSIEPNASPRLSILDWVPKAMEMVSKTADIIKETSPRDQ